VREFADTSDIPVPETLIEQVLGQEEACTIIRQAARQRRHVLLVGDPGTGKSMLGQAMAELIEITNPEDILVVPHPLEPTLPHIRRVPAGQGVQEVDRHRSRAHRGRSPSVSSSGLWSSPSCSSACISACERLRQPTCWGAPYW